MSNSIFEEEGKKPAATAQTAQQQIEKQARQLAYDTRYQVKKQVGEKKVNPAVMKRLLLQRLQKSTAAPNVKARAKQMLIGEDYIASGTEFATESVANAMFRVFVEGKTVSEETIANSIEEAYLSEMEKRGGEKFKVRVTDPKTGNSYIRYATMEKITQLRLKGLHVEKTKYGTPREDEARRGSQTASALGGGKKAKRDYDRDGKVESSSKEHAGAVHNAIQRKMGGTPDGKDTRKTVSASYEPSGDVLDERFNRGGGSIKPARPASESQSPTPTQSSKSIKSSKAAGMARRMRFMNVAKQTDEVQEAHKPGHEKGDGNLANNYPPYDKVTRGDVIAGRLGKDQKGGKAKAKVEEEFLADGSAYNPDANAKEIKPMKEGEKNKVTVFPSEKSVASNTIISAGTELKGKVIAETGYSKFLKKVQNLKEMSVSVNQQQAAGAALSAKRGKTDPSTLQGAAREMYNSMTEKQLRDFAKTKHKGLPEKVEEAVVDNKDPRDDKAYLEVIKNKFRALGDKKVMVVAEPQDLEKLYNKVATSDMIKREDTNVNEGLVTGTAKAINTVLKPVGQTPEEGKAAVQRLTRNIDVVAKPLKGAIRQAGENLGAGTDKNKQMIDKRRPQTLLQRQVASRTQQSINQSYEPEGEVIDERTRERKGEPRPDPSSLSHRVMMDVRNRNKEGVMTRSGRTVSQHESDRGVKKEPGAPTPTGETTADRLAAKKKRAAAAQASVQRAREDEERRRRLA